MGKVKGCVALCVRFPEEPMCGCCREATGMPFGASMGRYLASVTKISRTKATPHGDRGTHRQKHQNRTFKYMRVRGSIAQNYQILALKMRAGEKRWDEAEVIRLQKAATDELWSVRLKVRR